MPSPRTWPARSLLRAAAAAWLAAALVALLSGHALAAPAGEMYVAGYNALGQLGDGTNVDRLSVEPAPYFGFPVTAAAGTYGNTFALLAGGTVTATGSEEHGALGDGQSSGTRFIPAFVSGLAGVTGIAAGEDHFGLALLSNGTVMAWGLNQFGELGLGSTVEEDVPVPLPGIGQAVAVAAGCFDSYILLANGQVESVGRNQHGQLGDGASPSEQPLSATPVVVKGLQSVVAIAPGCETVYALRADGTVWSWGAGEHGQLGDGAAPLAAQTTPVQVKGLAGVLAIAGAREAGFALLSGGTVAAWGYNTTGELGDGTDEERKEPIIVPGIAGARAIGAASQDGYAVLADGSLWGWGQNEHGELGDGTQERQKPPEHLPAPAGVIALGTGSDDFGLLAIEGASAALSASALAFPAVQVGGRSAAQVVTFTNEGPAPLAVSGEVLTGPGAPAGGSFVRTADTCAGTTLAAGASCQVALAFAPAAAGPASATLAFSSTSANALPPVALSGTGTPPPVPPQLYGLRVTPRVAGLAGRRVHGRCVAARPRSRGPRCRRTPALRASFRLSAAARVSFRVVRLEAGVRAGRRCAARRGPRSRRSGRARTCTRAVLLRGGFSRTEGAGNHRLRLPGRVGGRALGAGTYRLLATPSAAGLTGATRAVAFRLRG
jgi:alpha-tubulin suppressor-like RCC1 family protein